MKRFYGLGLAWLLVCVPALAQESADDQFIAIYNLIQQADALLDQNQPRAAQLKYLAAQAALERFEASFPKWNDRIVNYRRHYLAEKLKALGVEAKPTAASPSDAAAALLPASSDPQIARLEEELRQLRAERDVLNAKLREALSAQPAAADPQELAKAENRIRQLQKENELLKAGVARAQPSPASLTAPVTPVKDAPADKPGAARNAEAARLREVEKERDELRKKVALLTRQLDDRRGRKGAVTTDQATEQLAILRARLEVYEARPAPYTPAELALLKPGATASGGALKAGSKAPLREPSAAAVALLEQAKREFQARRLDQAEAKLQEALKLDEKNVVTLTALAAVQVDRDRLDDADATLKRALAEDPNEARALTVLGILRIKQERYDEALDTLSRAAELDPDNAETQNYLGLALAHKGQRGPAETAFRRAVQLLPGYAEGHFNLASHYAMQKPPFVELARWHYQKALDAGHARHPELDAQLRVGGAGSATP